MNFLGIFRAQIDRLVVGYLMSAEIFEFRPNFDPCRLFNPKGRTASFYAARLPHTVSPLNEKMKKSRNLP